MLSGIEIKTVEERLDTPLISAESALSNNQMLLGCIERAIAATMQNITLSGAEYNIFRIKDVSTFVLRFRFFITMSCIQSVLFYKINIYANTCTCIWVHLKQFHTRCQNYCTVNCNNFELAQCQSPHFIIYIILQLVRAMASRGCFGYR